ncbi:MAG: NAD-dependent protein deacylase [Defluviitaleaceae bacterium]|nr:NAD-dependent protein deacylase [Defluviitaleaceae bacterium]MCL2274525.1 NAD-dependent protein deacylase [Defluviitaleaceae bacterium]
MNDTLKTWVQQSTNIVFFGGAGVSTESGIPDFRSADGLYAQKYAYPPEVMLSRSFFDHKPEVFFEFYRDKLLHEQVKPNTAHLALARLEESGKLRAVITQNIDGLHQMAGSKNVVELHGSVHRNFCMKCKKAHGVEEIKTSGIPLCLCGGTIKPDVVLFEEPLRNELMDDAVRYISQAEVLIIGGTSLSVYPAAGLVDYYRGDKLVLINNGETSRDVMANLLIRGSIGAALGGL